MEELQQCKTEESDVEKVGTSTASLEEEYAAVLETLNKYSSKSSIKSEASKTLVKSEMGSAVSLNNDGGDSPKVGRVHMHTLDVKFNAQMLHLAHNVIEDGTPATQGRRVQS